MGHTGPTFASHSHGDCSFHSLLLLCRLMNKIVPRRKILNRVRSVVTRRHREKAAGLEEPQPTPAPFLFGFIRR
jgi:hypothetical protein